MPLSDDAAEKLAREWSGARGYRPHRSASPNVQCYWNAYGDDMPRAVMLILEPGNTAYFSTEAAAYTALGHALHEIREAVGVPATEVVGRDGDKTIVRTGRYVFVLNANGTWIGVDTKPEVTDADRAYDDELAKELTPDHRTGTPRATDGVLSLDCRGGVPKFEVVTDSQPAVTPPTPAAEQFILNAIQEGVDAHAEVDPAEYWEHMYRTADTELARLRSREEAAAKVVEAAKNLGLGSGLHAVYFHPRPSFVTRIASIHPDAYEDERVIKEAVAELLAAIAAFDAGGGEATP